MAKRTVEFSAKIDRELADRFKTLYPMNGAVTWFITTALENFLELSEGDPTIRERTAQAVEHMVKENIKLAQFFRDIRRTVA